jgi:hypothetical protein
VNALEIKDALIDDLNAGGDMTTVIWETIRSRKSLKADWKAFEDTQRVLYQLYDGNTIDQHQLIIALRELLAAVMGRG